jgi:hypothetical protein
MAKSRSSALTSTGAQDGRSSMPFFTLLLLVSVTATVACVRGLDWQIGGHGCISGWPTPWS